MMASVTPRVWTRSRQWLGNVLPAALSLPILFIGIMLFKVDDPFSGPGLWLILAFPLFGWISLNLLGLCTNALMRDEMGRRYGREYGTAPDELWFVGMARPKFQSLLDPHEEVALIWRDGDTVHIMGDLTRHAILQSSIVGIKLRRNVHSWVLLGGWIQLTWQTPDGYQELFLEPRQRNTLLANRRLRRRLEIGRAHV